MFSKYLEMEQDARRAYGLVATGLGLIGLTWSFKRRGMLRPYQFGYAATWVTLGSGIMQWTQLGNEARMREVLEARGKADEEEDANGR